MKVLHPLEFWMLKCIPAGTYLKHWHLPLCANSHSETMLQLRFSPWRIPAMESRFPPCCLLLPVFCSPAGLAGVGDHAGWKWEWAGCDCLPPEVRRNDCIGFLFKNQKSLSEPAEMTAVTARGHHMFAQAELCGNVTLKDEARRMKFAWEVSVNFFGSSLFGERPKKLWCKDLLYSSFHRELHHHFNFPTSDWKEATCDFYP